MGPKQSSRPTNLNWPKRSWQSYITPNIIIGLIVGGFLFLCWTQRNVPISDYEAGLIMGIAIGR